MRRLGRLTRHVLFAALALAGVALVTLNVQAWRGALEPAEPWGGLAAPDGGGTVAAAPASTTAVPVERPARPAPQRGTTLTVVARRGECWLTVRAGSPTGRRLFEGTIARGERRAFAGERLWVTLGAASHVDLVLNGETVPAVGSGTIELVATEAGVRPS